MIDAVSAKEQRLLGESLRQIEAINEPAERPRGGTVLLSAEVPHQPPLI